MSSTALSYPKFLYADEAAPRRSDHSDDYRALPRPIGSIAYVAEGSAEYQTEGSVFSLSVGDILFIPIGGTYISYWSSRPLMKVLRFDAKPPEGKRYPVQRLDSLPGDREDFFAAAAQTGLIYEQLERFYRVCGRVFPRLKTVETKRIDERIRPAVEYIDGHLSGRVSAEELARLCHLSLTHFFVCFKKSLGVSPMEYKKRAVIMRAQILLTDNPGLSMNEIADSLGFESENYFRRVFKSVVGLSPREFRREGKI